jgi:very-long-chain (3R)-3-hydroxyacyl-CoA dehydratase
VPHVRGALELFQCLQVLDVVFSILKFTNNSVLATFPQIFSRVFLTMVFFPMVEYKSGQPNGGNFGGVLGIFLCLVNWSMIEVIRFAFYAVKASKLSGKLIDSVTDVLGHLRYNTFIFAYPLGVTGELLVVYYSYQVLAAMPVTERPLTMLMPNRWNFVFDLQSFMFVSPFFYLMGFPGLYMYMWSQRSRFYSVQKVKSQ